MFRFLLTVSNPYSCTISPHIYEKIDRHILIIKKLIDKTTTKQGWVIDAIKEKLERDANNQNLPKAKSLTVKIMDDLDKKIMMKVEFTKKFRFSYSKKQWLVDAVLEKLNRDEVQVEKQLLDQLQSQADIYKQQNDQLRSELNDMKATLLKYETVN